MRRLVVLALVLASCRKDEARTEPAPEPPPPPVVPAVLVAPVAPTPGPVPVPPALEIDAGVPPPASIDNRYLAYVYLLTVDVYLGEILDHYPGVPTSTRYNSFLFRWALPDARLQKRLREGIALASNYARAGSTDEVAAAVIAYTDILNAQLAPVLDLADYYEDKRYVDDEFARGRSEAAKVKRLRDDLARVRPALWSAVLAAWRTAAGDVPDSPRAVIGRAWEACVRVGQVVVSRGDEKALDQAVAACRKGVPTVVALPAHLHTGFDAILRDTAVELGDYAAGSRQEWEIPSEILEVTKAYLERWPKLPGAPAERAP